MRRSRISRKICIICLIIFIVSILVVNTNYNKPKEETRFETKVASTFKPVNNNNRLKILPEATPYDVPPKEESVINNNDSTKTKNNKKLKKRKVKKRKNRKRKNKLYYMNDNGCHYTLPKVYQDYLWQMCKKYKVTKYYKLFIAQMYHESGFDENCVSYTSDYGLMQINSCNHDWLSEKLGSNDFLDPYVSIEAGVLMMSKYLKKYSDVHKALVCYNRGESAVINGIYSTNYSKGVISDKNNLVEIIKKKGERT